jgi:fructosamine-3-kinase
MQVSASLLNHLEQQTGQDLSKHRLTRVGGGDINSAFQIKTQQINWFMKLNQASLAPMFTAEAAGLAEIESLQQVRVPKVILSGTHENQAYLLLEFIELGPLRSISAGKFGEQLARLHQMPQTYFGWSIDNTIGSTPQYNQQYTDWPTFWQQQRLGKQLEFAEKHGFKGELQQKGQTLLSQIPAFFTTYKPHPSLLHGDLWGGNVACDSFSNPVMFDPACYYGDRETDIAMTELFGGFSQEFYDAYQSTYPLDSGYKTRKSLYNLYHILNHLNLFGSGYLSQAHHLMDSLLSALK